jgi:hypothetical protein
MSKFAEPGHDCYIVKQRWPAHISKWPGKNNYVITMELNLSGPGTLGGVRIPHLDRWNGEELFALNCVKIHILISNWFIGWFLTMQILYV